MPWRARRRYAIGHKTNAGEAKHQHGPGGGFGDGRSKVRRDIEGRRNAPLRLLGSGSVHVPLMKAPFVPEARTNSKSEIAKPLPRLNAVLAAQPVDFRKSLHTLSALVSEALRANPYCGDVFVFRSKRMDRVKLLAWDGSGMVLVTKWLHQGRFT